MRHIFIINPAAGKKDQIARIYDITVWSVSVF